MRYMAPDGRHLARPLALGLAALPSAHLGCGLETESTAMLPWGCGAGLLAVSYAVQQTTKRLSLDQARAFWRLVAVKGVHSLIGCVLCVLAAKGLLHEFSGVLFLFPDVAVGGLGAALAGFPVLPYDSGARTPGSAFAATLLVGVFWLGALALGAIGLGQMDRLRARAPNSDQDRSVLSAEALARRGTAANTRTYASCL